MDGSTEVPRKRRRLSGLWPALAAGGARAVPHERHAVEQAITGFYSIHTGQDAGGGLPTPSNMRRMRPFLSVRLAEAIEAARRYQADYVAAHPAQKSPGGGPPIINKPPFVDGDLFSSLYEGARAFEVVDIEPHGEDTWVSTVRFHYDPDLDGWVDRIAVTRVDGHYGVDDVLYARTMGFGPKGKLSEVLAWRAPSAGR